MSEETKPLKCTVKQLKKTYTKLLIELCGLLTLCGAGIIAFILPVFCVLYTTMTPVIRWMQPALAYCVYHSNLVGGLTLEFAMVFVMVIGLMWMGYILFIVMIPSLMYIYKKTGVLNWFNHVGSYFDKLISDVPPTPVFSDIEKITGSWLENTIYTYLVKYPLEAMYFSGWAIAYCIARLGIQVVIATTVLIRALMWVNTTFPDPNYQNSTVFLVSLVIIVPVVMGLGYILDPLVACLITNLNVKFPGD